jgi:hypothetical protein
MAVSFAYECSTYSIVKMIRFEMNCFVGSWPVCAGGLSAIFFFESRSKMLFLRVLRMCNFLDVQDQMSNQVTPKRNAPGKSEAAIAPTAAKVQNVLRIGCSVGHGRIY